MLPAADLADAFPQHFGPRSLSFALDEKVVAGLPSVLATPSALVRRDLAYLIAETGPHGRTPRVAGSSV